MMQISTKTHRIAGLMANLIFEHVTQNGVTASQPGTSVSVTTGTGIDGAILSVKRFYPLKKNKFGGLGCFQKLDADEMVFESKDLAFAYAFERGYLKRHFVSPAIRQSRKASHVIPKYRLDVIAKNKSKKQANNA